MSAAASNAPEPERLYRIGDVSRLTDTKPFVLRFWETEFPMLQPVKAPKGHRLYRREDIDLIRAIKRLLYEEGFTIAGARRHLAEALAGGERGSLDPPTEVLQAPYSGDGSGIPQQSDRAFRARTGGHIEAPSTAPLTEDSRSALLAVRQELRAILTLLRAR